IGRRLARRAVALVPGTATQPATTDLVDLTRSAASTPSPAVAAAAHAALDRGETHYTARPGIPQLCAALAARSAGEGFPADAESVVVTNGGSEALYIALQSVARPGSRVLLAGPVAPNIPKMIAFIGATSIQVDSTASSPTAATIAGYDADVLLLASPSPITGVAIPPDELAAIVRQAGERGMAVILDRSLAWCCYDPVLAHFPDPDLGATILTTGSFSLAYEMAGWRAGYFTAPAQHAGAMLELKQAMSICTSAISQFAALAALEAADDWLNTKRSAMQTRRDAVILRLEQAGLSTIVPDSWPFLLLDTRLAHPDDRQAADMLREQAGVIVEPASIYGPSLAGYARITLAAGETALNDGLDRLIRFHSACS
ncbi:MAG TPA: aminotransferase class I/II-fold pyridoxal phosphate-dependent enzyme, partial [Thermomicrobiales bacterium]|nr:aminotransferase class I/II-fold pyridoxal phosphate-dependent enzyme [Thermomicrobiales bacterium]